MACVHTKQGKHSLPCHCFLRQCTTSICPLPSRMHMCGEMCSLFSIVLIDWSVLFNAFCAFWSVEEKDSSVSVLQHVTSLRYEHTWRCFLKGKRNCLRQIANVSSGTILCCLLRNVSPYLCVRLPIPVTAYLSLILILSPYCLGRFDRNFPFFSSPHPHLSSFFLGWWWWWWR